MLKQTEWHIYDIGYTKNGINIVFYNLNKHVIWKIYLRSTFY